jgi:hypothetical protein
VWRAGLSGSKSSSQPLRTRCGVATVHLDRRRQCSRYCVTHSLGQQQITPYMTHNITEMHCWLSPCSSGCYAPGNGCHSTAADALAHQLDITRIVTECNITAILMHCWTSPCSMGCCAPQDACHSTAAHARTKPPGPAPTTAPAPSHAQAAHRAAAAAVHWRQAAV